MRMSRLGWYYTIGIITSTPDLSRTAQSSLYRLTSIFSMPHLRCLANPFVLMFRSQAQLLLDLLHLLRIARKLRVSFISLVKWQTQLTLPISSDSLTQLRPFILFNLMTILSGVEVFEGSDFFLKSLVRKVPIPKDASHQSSISQNAYRTQNSPAIPCSSHIA
jgi:hypothetical protein